MFVSSAKESVNDKERAKAAVDHIEEGGRRVKRDARDSANRVQDDLSSTVHSIGEQMREFAENAGEGLAFAKNSISDAGDKVAAQIQRKPLPAGAILLGAGLLLGAFLWRR